MHYFLKILSHLLKTQNSVEPDQLQLIRIYTLFQTHSGSKFVGSILTNKLRMVKNEYTGLAETQVLA